MTSNPSLTVGVSGLLRSAQPLILAVHRIHVRALFLNERPGGELIGGELDAKANVASLHATAVDAIDGVLAGRQVERLVGDLLAGLDVIDRPLDPGDGEFRRDRGGDANVGHRSAALSPQMISYCVSLPTSTGSFVSTSTISRPAVPNRPVRASAVARRPPSAEALAELTDSPTAEPRSALRQSGSAPQSVPRDHCTCVPTSRPF